MRYLVTVLNGSCSLVMTERNKDAAWLSLGALCRARDWSRPRAIYELQNGLLFRTVPPGYEHKINWHDPRLQLDLAASEASSELLSPALTVGIEVMAPSSDIAPAAEAMASAQWAAAATRNLRADNRIPEGITKADLARLLEIEARKAVKVGQLSRALKATYLENVLADWGIWPLDSFK